MSPYTVTLKRPVIIRGKYRKTVKVWGRGASDCYFVTPANYQSDLRCWIVFSDNVEAEAAQS